jgi:Leucine-rich repeat (LRR) protein
MLRSAVCVLLFASFVWAAGPSDTWITSLGGSATRDRSGQITGVDLSTSWVTDSDLPELAEQTSLTKLDLSMTRITDRGLLALKPLSNLTDLNLYYAEMVTDQGLAVLKNLKALKRLNLRGTKITDSTLQTLNSLTSLESLDIGFAQVTDSGILRLGALSNLKEFSIGGNKLTDAGLQILRQMPALTSLDVSGSQRTDSGLWSVSLTESGLATISTLKSLSHLRLNGMGVSPRGLAQLKDLAKLDRLDLQSCGRINDEAVPSLKSFAALKVVDVSAAALTDKGLEELHKAKPGLRIIASDFKPAKPAMPNGPAN